MPDPDRSTRFINLAAARAEFGDRVDRLGLALHEGDPLADAAVDALADVPSADRHALLDRALDHGITAVPDAPAALLALFAQLDRVPFWVDFERADRGG